MSSRLVVDASVILAWVLGESETSGRSGAVLAALQARSAVVPALWWIEVANVLLVKERQRRIDEPFVRKALKAIEQLPIEVDGTLASQTLPRVVLLARRHQLSAYDATYLELALRGKMPLATFDAALAAAAKREDVERFEG